jgi:hypothetical protein
MRPEDELPAGELGWVWNETARDSFGGWRVFMGHYGPEDEGCFGPKIVGMKSWARKISSTT